jgi:hypothetical protein
MKKIAAIIGVILISQVISSVAYPQGYQPVTPLYSPQDMRSAQTSSDQPFRIITPMLNSSGQSVSGDPIIGKFDAVLHQLVVHWPKESVNLSQIKSILTQNPNAQNLKLLFPNKSEWMISQSEFQELFNQYNSQASNLGFGAGGGTIPDLILSSLSGNQISPGSLAVLPIAAVKEGFKGVGETLEPLLREIRYQQLAISEYLPDWLKVALLELFNLVITVYFTIEACIFSLVMYVLSLI